VIEATVIAMLFSRGFDKVAFAGCAVEWGEMRLDGRWAGAT
jgi:hypothetical protein